MQGPLDPATGEFNRVTKGVEKHMSAQEAKDFNDDDVWTSYFKFAVVRNPWDRLHSIWWNSRHIDRLHDLGLDEFFDTYLQLPWHRRLLAKLSRRFDVLQALKPQSETLRLTNGSMELDAVYRFEAIADAYRDLAGRLTLTADMPKILVANRAPETRQPYVDDFTPTLVDVVGEYYADDVRTFGYEFGR